MAMSPLILIFAGLAEAGAPTDAPRPSSSTTDTASHKAGAFVQLETGASVCGAHGGADCRGAGTGFALGGRIGWQALPWVAVAAGAHASGLPVEGQPPGRFFFAGPGLRLALPYDRLRLEAGGTVGYARVGGEDAALSGFGAWRVDAALTWRLADRFPVGLGYAFTRPRGGEVCEDDRCTDVDVASLHQFLVVGGAWF
jgi:hypothetical protein